MSYFDYHPTLSHHDQQFLHHLMLYSEECGILLLGKKTNFRDRDQSSWTIKPAGSHFNSWSIKADLWGPFHSYDISWNVTTQRSEPTSLHVPLCYRKDYTEFAEWDTSERKCLPRNWNTHLLVGIWIQMGIWRAVEKRSKRRW